MMTSYGNLQDLKSSIVDIVIMNDFQYYWNLNKDTIDGCKDCEYRYICTDYRAYISNPKASLVSH
jgi:radical SAM protein with 4Fe4S-binding SPASM domain